MARNVFSLVESTDINRSAEDVFAWLLESPDLIAARSAQSKVDVERLAGDGTIAPGSIWRISGETRLGRRTGKVAVTNAKRPETLAFLGEGRGFAAQTTIVLAAKGDAACRMTVTVDLSAISFAARLFAPGVRLWRRRAAKGLKKGLRFVKRAVERPARPS